MDFEQLFEQVFQTTIERVKTSKPNLKDQSAIVTLLQHAHQFVCVDRKSPAELAALTSIPLLPDTQIRDLVDPESGSAYGRLSHDSVEIFIYWIIGHSSNSEDVWTRGGPCNSLASLRRKNKKAVAYYDTLIGQPTSSWYRHRISLIHHEREACEVKLAITYLQPNRQRRKSQEDQSPVDSRLRQPRMHAPVRTVVEVPPQSAPQPPPPAQPVAPGLEALEELDDDKFDYRAPFGNRGPFSPQPPPSSPFAQPINQPVQQNFSPYATHSVPASPYSIPQTPNGVESGIIKLSPRSSSPRQQPFSPGVPGSQHSPQSLSQLETQMLNFTFDQQSPGYYPQYASSFPTSPLQQPLGGYTPPMSPFHTGSFSPQHFAPSSPLRASTGPPTSPLQEPIFQYQEPAISSPQRQHAPQSPMRSVPGSPSPFPDQTPSSPFPPSSPYRQAPNSPYPTGSPVWPTSSSPFPPSSPAHLSQAFVSSPPMSPIAQAPSSPSPFPPSSPARGTEPPVQALQIQQIPNPTDITNLTPYQVNELKMVLSRCLQVLGTQDQQGRGFVSVSEASKAAHATLHGWPSKVFNQCFQHMKNERRIIDEMRGTMRFWRLL